ncbi:hypothetical protein COO60DRAFT_657917 [Scenedesmus sp. NREL 46B-D3]|nr:hypothetical protein COO60DRAFT_657917 [Scenedesmus sp. NREL 46B-D3]
MPLRLQLLQQQLLVMVQLHVSRTASAPKPAAAQRHRAKQLLPKEGMQQLRARDQSRLHFTPRGLVHCASVLHSLLHRGRQPHSRRAPKVRWRLAGLVCMRGASTVQWLRAEWASSAKHVLLAAICMQASVHATQTCRVSFVSDCGQLYPSLTLFSPACLQAHPTPLMLLHQQQMLPALVQQQQQLLLQTCSGWTSTSLLALTSCWCTGARWERCRPGCRCTWRHAGPATAPHACC